MGKRELLLIVGFIVLGVVVYQVTTPAARPRQAAGPSRRSSATSASTSTRTAAVGPGAFRVEREVPDEVTELRITGVRGNVTLVGADEPRCRASSRW